MKNRLLVNENKYVFWLPLLLGMVACFWVIGPAVINPNNIGWIFEGDRVQHYLGWQFFRQTSWSLPLGLNPGFGLELSNAIIFSDSIPLLAMLFKPLSGILPEDFQYFGLWILACFILQAWFGWKLASILSPSVIIRLLCCALFVFVPPMIHRFYFAHSSLAGHFLILAALYLLFAPRQEMRSWRWIMLLVVTALVHAYLLAMVAAIWLADLWGDFFGKRLPAKKLFAETICVFSVLSLVCWQVGYFSVKGGAIAAGFGYYRANLLTMFDPSGWSYVLKDIPEGPGDYEGFNFLGLGVLLMVVMAVPMALVKWRDIIAQARRYWVLLIVLVGLTLFAFTNKPGIASLNLSYSLPDIVLRLANTFRASGRMLWPVVYVLIFGLMCLLVRTASRNMAVALLAGVLAIQMIDTRAGWMPLHDKVSAMAHDKWKKTLTDPFWEEAAQRYKKVRWIGPENLSAHWDVLSYYAAQKGLQTDAVYLARIDNDALTAAQSRAVKAIESGRYERDSLYVLSDAALIRASSSLDAGNDLMARIDGLNVIAPGWRDCNKCQVQPATLDLLEAFKVVKVGESMKFVQNNEATRFLISGWSSNESWGTWSSGNKAQITFLMSGPLHSMRLQLRALLSSAHTGQRITIFLNGEKVYSGVLTQGESVVEVLVPEDVGRRLEGQARVDVDFDLPDAVSPADLGISEDSRKLAIGLRSISLQ